MLTSSSYHGGWKPPVFANGTSPQHSQCWHSSPPAALPFNATTVTRNTTVACTAMTRATDQPMSFKWLSFAPNATRTDICPQLATMTRYTTAIGTSAVDSQNMLNSTTTGNLSITYSTPRPSQFTFVSLATGLGFARTTLWVYLLLLACLSQF